MGQRKSKRDNVLEEVLIPGTVPVLVDSLKEYGDFRMARCMYFSIECDTPGAGWTLSLRSETIPFLMLGLSGIITSELRGREFQSVDDIEALFESIEEHDSLYIDINDVWLPLELFADIKDFKRSPLYRIPSELFSMAYDYTSTRLPMGEYLGRVREFMRAMAQRPPEKKGAEKPPGQWLLESSALESKVFLDWEKQTIAKRMEMRLTGKQESLALGRGEGKNG